MFSSASSPVRLSSSTSPLRDSSSSPIFLISSESAASMDSFFPPIAVVNEAESSSESAEKASSFSFIIESMRLAISSALSARRVFRLSTSASSETLSCSSLSLTPDTAASISPFTASLLLSTEETKEESAVSAEERIALSFSSSWDSVVSSSPRSSSRLFFPSSRLRRISSRLFSVSMVASSALRISSAENASNSDLSDPT